MPEIPTPVPKLKRPTDDATPRSKTKTTRWSLGHVGRSGQCPLLKVLEECDIAAFVLVEERSRIGKAEVETRNTGSGMLASARILPMNNFRTSRATFGGFYQGRQHSWDTCSSTCVYVSQEEHSRLILTKTHFVIWLDMRTTPLDWWFIFPYIIVLLSLSTRTISSAPSFLVHFPFQFGMPSTFADIYFNSLCLSIPDPLKPQRPRAAEMHIETTKWKRKGLNMTPSPETKKL